MLSFRVPAWLVALALIAPLPASGALALEAERAPSDQALLRFAQATAAPPASTATSKVFAFAKASPLQVSDSATPGNAAQQFEFGKAYEVTEESSGFLKVKLSDSKSVYVRSTYMTSTSSPRWLASGPGYNRPERARVQFWESAVKLSNFISGTDRLGSQYDYEEFYDAAPAFQLKLPSVEGDLVDLLNRQIKIVSVMMPISKQMYQAFESAKSSSERPLDLNLVVDVSGSTTGFLERTVGGIAKSLNRNEQFRKRVRSVVVTTFGASSANKSSFLGKVPLNEIEKVVWHPPGVNQATDGEREPLVDGLVTLNESLKADEGATQVLVVLSGADVELATIASSRPVTVGAFELSLHKQPAAILAQITPEPGEDLRNASRQLSKFPRMRYIDYSETIADDIVQNLYLIAESQKTTSVTPRTFNPVVAAGNDKRMMTFLPRVLTPASSLPARQPFAAQSDWYTIRLWVTVDDLILKETP
jgi:hypothetical protein